LRNLSVWNDRSVLSREYHSGRCTLAEEALTARIVIALQEFTNVDPQWRASMATRRALF